MKETFRKDSLRFWQRKRIYKITLLSAHRQTRKKTAIMKRYFLVNGGFIMQTLSSLITDYLEVGEYEKRLSPDTIKAYRIDLRQFLEFTGGD